MHEFKSFLLIDRSVKRKLFLRVNPTLKPLQTLSKQIPLQIPVQIKPLNDRTELRNITQKVRMFADKDPKGERRETFLKIRDLVEGIGAPPLTELGINQRKRNLDKINKQ